MQLSQFGGKDGVGYHLESVSSFFHILKPGSLLFIYLFKITDILKMTKIVHADEKYPRCYNLDVCKIREVCPHSSQLKSARLDSTSLDFFQ